MFPMLPMDFGDKLQRANDGGAFIMYAPIYPGDTFTTVCDDMVIEDLTPPSGQFSAQQIRSMRCSPFSFTYFLVTYPFPIMQSEHMP